MKKLDPVESLRQVGGETPAMAEQAQVAAAAYGRIEEEPAPPDAATGLPMPAHDSTLSWGGGYSATVSSGRGDDVPFPQEVAGVNGVRSSVNPEPSFGDVTPNEPDGFTDSGSGVENITRGRR